jgi:hypothetical protein
MCLLDMEFDIYGFLIVGTPRNGQCLHLHQLRDVQVWLDRVELPESMIFYLPNYFSFI